MKLVIIRVCIAFTDMRCVFVLNCGNKHKMKSFDKPCFSSYCSPEKNIDSYP